MAWTCEPVILVAGCSYVLLAILLCSKFVESGIGTGIIFCNFCNLLDLYTFNFNNQFIRHSTSATHLVEQAIAECNMWQKSSSCHAVVEKHTATKKWYYNRIWGRFPTNWFPTNRSTHNITKLTKNHWRPFPCKQITTGSMQKNLQSWTFGCTVAGTLTQ